jgi:hypothetical protein
MGRHEVGFQDNTQKFEINEGNGCRMESHFLINKVRKQTGQGHNPQKVRKQTETCHIIVEGMNTNCVSQGQGQNPQKVRKQTETSYHSRRDEYKLCLTRSRSQSM